MQEKLQSISRISGLVKISFYLTTLKLIDIRY